MCKGRGKWDGGGIWRLDEASCCCPRHGYVRASHGILVIVEGKREGEGGGSEYGVVDLRKSLFAIGLVSQLVLLDCCYLLQ